LRNLKRYAGVDAARVEQMEHRLKEDILYEARQFGGLILTHEEQRIIYLFIYLFFIL